MHPTRVLFAAFFAISTTLAGGSAIRINEVRPDARPGPQDVFLSAEIELYNAGAVAEDAAGYTLTAADGTAIVTLPPGTLVQPGDFLTVELGAGILNPAGDEIGLYPGDPATSTIVDYVAWSRNGPFTGGATQTDAVAAGIWTDDAYVDLSGHGILSTIGLAPDGFDHDLPGDWREFDWGTYFAAGGGNAPENPLQIAPVDGTLVDQADPDLVWAPVAAAMSYLLEVDDDPGFGSPEISQESANTSFTVTGALPDGVYSWRVRVRDGGGVLVPEHRVFTFVKLWDVTLPASADAAAAGFLGGISGAAISGFTRLIQHKDSKLLCLWDAAKSKRPGCSEEPSDNGPWDDAHPEASGHVRKCGHCNYYCTRASIQMVNRLYGGDLSQDRISYRMFNSLRPQPEEDLRHGHGPTLARRHEAYAWALQLAQAQVVRTGGAKPGFATIMQEIDAGRPILIDGSRHTTVLYGYATVMVDGSDVRGVLIGDPWPGNPDWHLYDTWQPDSGGWPAAGYFLLPMGVAISGRMEEASVGTDTDGDGVMDFDEGNPRALQSDPTKKDTDADQLQDKNDIRSYTFHDKYHIGHENDPIGFSDFDGDGLRSENDCDSDGPDAVGGDGDFDGGEDYDGNGRQIILAGPPEQRETCMFDPADFALEVNVDKDVYSVGEPVYLVDSHPMRPTHTFHRHSDYFYELGPGCPDKTNDSPLVHSGAFETDGKGHAKETLVQYCPRPGTYHLTVDVLGDMNYSEPDNHDPQTCWECLPDYYGYLGPRGYARFELRFPAGSPVGVPVSFLGDVTFSVDFTTVGDADSDGLEDVDVDLDFDLVGHTVGQGRLELRARDASMHPDQPCDCSLEETVNVSTGAIDVPPLNTGGGPVTHDLAVYLELEITETGEILHSHDPLNLFGTSGMLPPGENEKLTASTDVTLFDDDENPVLDFGIGFLIFDALKPDIEETGYDVEVFGPGVGAKGLEASPGGVWGDYVYVADSAAGAIERVDAEGNVEVFAQGLGFPVGLAFSLELEPEFGDHLYVSEFAGDQVVRVDSAGNLTFFSSTSNPGDLAFPSAASPLASGTGFPAALYSTRAFTGPVETIDGGGTAAFFSDIAGTYLGFGPGGVWGDDLYSTRHGGAGTLTFTIPVGAPIPDAPGSTLSIPVVFPQSTIISDLDVRVVATHPRIDDLEVAVEPPGRAPIVLWDRGCSAEGPYRDLDARFDDEGTANGCNILGPTPAADDGNGRRPPDGGPLAVLDGTDAAGTWTLHVTDHATGNAGTLDEWSLIIAESNTGIATVAADGSHQLHSAGFVNPEGFDWAQGPGWNGDLFATDNTTGEIWRVKPDGSRSRFATLPDAADVAFHGCALWIVGEFGGCWRVTSAADDLDGDGHGDLCDNCPGAANPAQGPVFFGQEIVATGADTFGWPTAADVTWVRGDLDLVGSYTVDTIQSMSGATSFTDTDTPTTGYYYIVKHDCPAASWQTFRNGEPARDATLP